jgi:hypothetical protein
LKAPVTPPKAVRAAEFGSRCEGEEVSEAKESKAEATKESTRRQGERGQGRQGKRKGTTRRVNMSDDLSSAHFVAWFRSVAPYVNLFRGKTFLIAFGGKAIAGPIGAHAGV